jgi:hypothetical protein
MLTGRNDDSTMKETCAMRHRPQSAVFKLSQPNLAPLPKRRVWARD